MFETSAFEKRLLVCCSATNQTIIRDRNEHYKQCWPFALRTFQNIDVELKYTDRSLSYEVLIFLFRCCLCWFLKLVTCKLWLTCTKKILLNAYLIENYELNVLRAGIEAASSGHLGKPLRWTFNHLLNASNLMILLCIECLIDCMKYEVKMAIICYQICHKALKHILEIYFVYIYQQFVNYINLYYTSNNTIHKKQ